MSDPSMPLHNLDAERSVLGAMLRWPSTIDDAAVIVKRESFHSDAHQRIYAAILDLHARGVKVDLVTTVEEIDRRKQVEEIGGYGILAVLWEKAPTGAMVTHHANIVREYAILRGLVLTANEMLANVQNRTGPAADLLREAEANIFRLAEEGVIGTTTDLVTSIYEAMNRLDSRASGQSVGEYVPTGLVDLDRVLAGGLQANELILLGARTSVGKSALAVNFARQAARGGYGVFFASLEMSRVDLAERFICAEAMVDAQRLRKATLSDDEKDRILEAGNAYRHAATVEIDDVPNQSMTRIAANARRLKLRKNIRIVIVDYLQLIEAENRRVARYEQVGEISRRLKVLARELKMPVVALVQVNRQAEGRVNNKPKLSDLREAGNLEQDADTVILLREHEDGGAITCDVAKQRNGPKEEVTLTFQREYQRFDNYAAPMGYSGGSI